MITTPLSTEEQDLMIKNMGLVKYWAKTYIGKTQSMDFDDLIQAGYEGLIKAIRGFDESLGYTFATYAQWGINRAIIRAIRTEDKMIRIPERYYSKYNEYRNSGKNIHDFCEESKMNEDIFRRIVTLMKPCLSLDQPIITDGLEHDDYTAMIKDDSPSQEQIIIYHELKKELDDIFFELEQSGVSKRNIDITIRYYSTDDTLDIIGKDYGLTRERVRQIIENVINKVGAKLRHRNLSDYLHDSYECDFISIEG